MACSLTCRSAPTTPPDEFEERAKQIEQEETQRLETAPPTDAPAGLLESAGCEHLREWQRGIDGLLAGHSFHPLAEVSSGWNFTRPNQTVLVPAAGAGDAHFAHGMCKACYLEFIQVSSFAGCGMGWGWGGTAQARAQ